MPELMKPQQRYWIISFSGTDAHIVEADGPDEIVRNPISTYHVHYRDLVYKYIDIDKEARDIAKGRKFQIDPKVIFDLSITIDDHLALPQMAGRQNDREYLANSLEVLRTMPEDLQKEKIREYENAQKKSEQELYKEILGELQQKRNYIPPQIRNFRRGELAFGLPQAGYITDITGRKGFVTMDDALDTLYYAWEDIWKNPEKTELALKAEKLAMIQAQDRMSKFFEEAFS